MLTDALRAIINNPFKESFYGKKNTHTHTTTTTSITNVLTIFFIFHKSGVKTFLKWIVNHCPKTLVSMTLNNKSIFYLHLKV